MIAIIDYGLGNIMAFSNVYKNLGLPFKISSRVDDLNNITKIILPGVGSFDHAIERLGRSGMRDSLDELVLHRKLPVLGICVGMQMLAFSSEEGKLSGLGWMDGVVKKINISSLNQRTHLPHMGWNHVNPVQKNGLFKDLDNDSRFYFLHSYYFQCNNDGDIIATTEYGTQFPCAVNSDNIYGVQFHPEKSHQNGIQVLRNFGML